MKINRNSGVVFLDDGKLLSYFEKSEFEQSSLGKQSELFNTSDKWVTYRMRVKDGVDQFIAVLYFKDNTLYQLNMVLSNNESDSWSNWSEEKELQQKAIHDRLLLKMLNQPPYKYSWGEVQSVYDPRSGCSKIVISYHH